MSPDSPPSPVHDAPAGRLRARLSRGRLTVPSCYDALGFRMIARAGFPAAFLSGFSVSAARLGLPDAGLLSYGEMAAQARDVAASAPIPLIVDADTGFGNAQNVQRTVRGLAAAGAACLMLELVLAAAAAFRDALAAMAAGRPLAGDRAVTSGEIGDIVGVTDYLAVERDLGR